MELTATIHHIRPSFGTEVCHMYYGELTLLNTSHHATFIRVKEGDLVEPYDDAPGDVKSRFDDMQHFYEGAYHTIELPNIPGRFVMFVFPFAE